MQNLAAIRKQAQDSNTPPKILNKLASSQDYLTRKYVAANPNTSLETLERLGRKLSDAIVSNPVFDLLLLEQPENQFLKLCLARASNTPVTTLEKLIDTNDYEILIAIATRSNLPNSILEMLSQHHSSSARRIIASLPQLPLSIIENLALDENHPVRAQIARHPKTPLYIIEILAEDRDYSVRASVASRLDLSVSMLEKLSKDIDNQVRSNVARHPKLPLAIIETLAQDPDGLVRGEIAERSKLPLPIIESLVRDSAVLVRHNISKRFDLPLSILEILAKDKDVNIRCNIASDPNLSLSILKNFTQDKNFSIRNRVSNRQDLPLSIIEILAKDKHSDIRNNIAANIITPPHILTQLADDSYLPVRQSVAINLNTPQAIKQKIVQDYLKNTYATKELDCNNWLLNTPVTPQENVDKITNHIIKQKYIVNHYCKTNRISIASRAYYHKVIEHFANDSKIKVRRAVASNPQCPISILEKLLENNEPTIHQALLNNPNSSDRLKQIIKFILGIKTPTVELLSILADSPHYYLKKLVAKDLKTPPETLLKLASDRDYRIRKTLLFRNDLNLEIIDRILEVTIDKFISRKTAFKVSKENYILCAIARYQQSDRFSNSDKQHISKKLHSFLDSNLGDSCLIHQERIKNTIEMISVS